jgi:hypothetical protein
MRSVCIAIASLLWASSAFATEPDPPTWSSVASESTLVVLSENADGTPHETTVWLAVVDGQGFIRTGNTSWYPNLERKPDIAVRIAGKEYAVHAELLTDEALQAKVIAAFNAKYGWQDTVVGWFFRGKPHVVRLAPRPAVP